VGGASVAALIRAASRSLFEFSRGIPLASRVHTSSDELLRSAELIQQADVRDEICDGAPTLATAGRRYWRADKRRNGCSMSEIGDRGALTAR
jgi:hypothetical protein